MHIVVVSKTKCNVFKFKENKSSFEFYNAIKSKKESLLSKFYLLKQQQLISGKSKPF